MLIYAYLLKDVATSEAWVLQNLEPDLYCTRTRYLYSLDTRGYLSDCIFFYDIETVPITLYIIFIFSVILHCIFFCYMFTYFCFLLIGHVCLFQNQNYIPLWIILQVNNILSAIKRKKSMDTLILSLVASVCTFLILIYWLTKWGCFTLLGSQLVQTVLCSLSSVCTFLHSLCHAEKESFSG